MKYLPFAFLIIVGCAPLNPHATPLEQTGEFVGRTVLCPLTLCMSEVGFAQNYKNEQMQTSYEQWRQTLSETDRAQEDRRRADMERSLAIALSGRPTVIHPYQPRWMQGNTGTVSCATNQSGDSLYTTCR